MENEFKYCKKCGEMYFIEHLDNNCICKVCNDGLWRYKFNEQISNNED